jgi:hypothetical protein
MPWHMPARERRRRGDAGCGGGTYQGVGCRKMNRNLRYKQDSYRSNRRIRDRCCSVAKKNSMLSMPIVQTETIAKQLLRLSHSDRQYVSKATFLLYRLTLWKGGGVFVVACRIIQLIILCAAGHSKLWLLTNNNKKFVKIIDYVVFIHRHFHKLAIWWLWCECASDMISQIVRLSLVAIASLWILPYNSPTMRRRDNKARRRVLCKLEALVWFSDETVPKPCQNLGG